MMAGAWPARVQGVAGASAARREETSTGAPHTCNMSLILLSCKARFRMPLPQ